MSDRSKEEIPRDEEGRILHFDGTGNCSLFHERFDSYMTGKGYAGNIAVDNYEVPYVQKMRSRESTSTLVSTMTSRV